MSDIPIELTLFYHGGTTKSICVSENQKDKKWIPISLCNEVGEPFLSGFFKEIIISVPEWVAFEKELI